nr:ankyrin repeat and zinc finger domain-containing protein 1-like [Penaeus vannamei]
MASANSYKNLRDLAGAGDGQALRSALASLPPRAKKDFLGKPVCPSGRLLLHQAAEEGREEVVEILVEAGADVSAKDNRGKLSLRVLYFSFTLILTIMVLTIDDSISEDDCW